MPACVPISNPKPKQQNAPLIAVKKNAAAMGAKAHAVHAIQEKHATAMGLACVYQVAQIRHAVMMAAAAVAVHVTRI